MQQSSLEHYLPYKMFNFDIILQTGLLCLLARAHPWLQTWTLTKAKEHLYIGLPRCSVHSSQIISWTAPTEVT